MKKEIDSYPDYYELGSIIRTHGIKGDVVIYLDTDEPGRYKKMKNAWLEINGTLKEYKVSKSSVADKTAIIHLDGIDDINVAENYIKHRIFLPLSSLPKLSGKNFYFHEIIGFTVIDKTEGEIGPLTDVFELTQHPVGEADWKGVKVLFPLIKDFIQEIKREEKQLLVDLPEGMLDVYR